MTLTALRVVAVIGLIAAWWLLGELMKFAHFLWRIR